MFAIENCENCTLVVCDQCDQIQVDNVKKCRIFLGASASSIFLRNCEDCVFYTCSQQLRLRDCVRCDLYVYSFAEVHIELSNKVRLAPFRGGYPAHADHLKACKLNLAHNLWYDVFDHNDTLKTKENWSLMDEKEYEEPWFPLGACTPAIAVTSVGSVDRSKESDGSSLISFGVEQLQVDAQSHAPVSPGKAAHPGAAPVHLPVPETVGGVTIPPAVTEAVAEVEAKVVPPLPAAERADVPPPPAPQAEATSFAAAVEPGVPPVSSPEQA
jgi:hypothetical protein